MRKKAGFDFCLSRIDWIIVVWSFLWPFHMRQVAGGEGLKLVWLLRPIWMGLVF